MVGQIDRKGLRDDAASRSWNSSHPSGGAVEGAAKPTSAAPAAMDYSIASRLNAFISALIMEKGRDATAEFQSLPHVPLNEITSFPSVLNRAVYWVAWPSRAPRD